MNKGATNKINFEKKNTFFVYDAPKNSYLYWENKQPIYTKNQPTNQPYIALLRYKEIEIEDSVVATYDFFMQEGLRSRWFSLLEQVGQEVRFQSGALTFSSKKQGKQDFIFSLHEGAYTLLRWKHNQTIYKNNLTQVDYFSFVEKVAKIEEFQQEPYWIELSMVDAMQGVFLCLEDKGIACIQMVGSDFLYVSYIALLPAYRKMGQSKMLLEGLFSIANRLKKDIVVAVTALPLIDLYEKNNFFVCGYWQEG